MDGSIAGNPFPGLRPYAYEEAAFFFGRDRQSDSLVRRLAGERFVAVVGASGSGKSSLVRAGLLPSLEAGLMATAGAHWRFCLFRPQNDPIGFLTRALIGAGVVPPLELSGDAAATVVETTLRRSSLGLINACRLARLEAHENVLIVVDQFEELFRFADEARRSGRGDDAPAFVRMLLEAAQQTNVPIYIVITMRSDFLGDCDRFRGLAEAISLSQYLVPRLSRDELQAAITGPLGVGRAEAEPILVQTVLNRVGDDMDQLPLLQHALMRTYGRWQRRVPATGKVELRDLDDVGGLGGALSQHAEEAFGSLAGPREQAIAERVFQSLTERGPDNRELRRPRALSQLARIVGATRTEILPVLDVFRASGRSFLLPSAEVELTDDSVIDISHESLIRQWARLRQWVADESESRATYDRLQEAARLYETGRGGLWGEPDLTYSRQWHARQSPTTQWAEQYGGQLSRVVDFLERSEAALAVELEDERRRTEEAARTKQRELEQAQALADEQRRRADDQSAARARQRVLIVALTVSLAAAVLAAVMAWQSRGTALENAADAQRLASLASESAEKAGQQAKLADERRAALQKVLAAVSDPGARQALTEQFLPDAAKQLSPEEEQAKLEVEKTRASDGTKTTARVENGGLNLWTNGSTLRIRFLDGDPAVQAKVVRVAQEWSQHANLTFGSAMDSDAELRVSFKDPGVWSFVGTDALGVSADSPTMNFGWLTASTDDREFRRAVLHEFGHVLGLVHEYNNPNADIPWDKPTVIKLFSGPPNFWDRQAIEANLFAKAQVPRASYREYDSKSIMMLGEFDAKHFTRPFSISVNDELSDSDKSFVARLYPRR